MMRSEFIERTGFEPMSDEYDEIEREYMGTEVDKDEFCKTWIKQGGIQRLMRVRARKIEELEAEVLKREREYNEMDARYCNKINEMNSRKDAEAEQLRADNRNRIIAQKVLEERLNDAEARAAEAERKMAVLKEAFAILTGKEEK